MERNAVVTGARTGIGYATVEKFAQEGINVWACAHTPNEEFEKKIQELAQKYSVWIKPVYFDLEDEDAVKNAAKEIIKEKKSIDILVNNAGIFPKLTAFQMTSMKEFRRVFEVNFFSVVTLTQLFSKIMMRQGSGNIINVSSTAGLDVEQGVTAYAASKAAIACLTKDLSSELAGYGIRVNGVAPGLITTGINEHIDTAVRENMVGTIALKREGSPKEVADVIGYLVSENSSYITGQIIRVDGGK